MPGQPTRNPRRSAATPSHSAQTPHAQHQSVPTSQMQHRSAPTPHGPLHPAPTQHKANGHHPEPTANQTHQTNPTDAQRPYPEQVLPRLNHEFCARFTPKVPEPIVLPANGPEPKADTVLLVIPTDNKHKVKLFQDYLKLKQPSHVNHLPELIFPKGSGVDSGVGEQPYDDAGPRGAFNRVLSALGKLRDDETWQKKLISSRAATVVVGAVESFMMRRGEEKPVDYGVIVFCRVPVIRSGDEHHDQGKWVVGASKGVTAPKECWKEAESHDFEDGKHGKHGKETVGAIIAQHNKHIDKANWHLPLAGVSRYDLLEEAANSLAVPWPTAPSESHPPAGKHTPAH